MAPLPVIPDVFRVTMNYQAYQGITPVNVFHVRAPSAADGDVALAINEASDGVECMQGMPGSYHPNSMSILALDGTSPTTIHSVDTESWTTASSETAQVVPEGAAVVSLRTPQRGPQGRGRVFIGPLEEATVDSGVIVGDTPAFLEGAWNTFNENLVAGAGTITLVVASYAHGESYDVTSLSVSTEMATQRRRLLQTRA